MEILEVDSAFVDFMTAQVGSREHVAVVSPVQELREEHALARRMLAVLDRMVVGVRCGIEFPAADVARVLSFFREFVETVHHAKEDGTVYPAAMAIGDDAVVQAVGELIADHDATRDLLHSLMLFWEPGPLLDDEREGFCELARTYAARLRRHMQLEEDVLFPHAARLSAAEHERMSRVLDHTAQQRRSAAAWRLEIEALEAVWVEAT